MLYIMRGNHKETEWHIQDPAPVEGGDTVTMIQADCDELEHIRANFPGLVIPKKRVVRWYGDMAKFIVGNL